MRELMIFEIKKTCLLYAASLLVLFGYILFRPSPHGFFDLILVFIAFVHGALIGGRIFYDNKRTQAFIFTLPLTRTRLFSYRMIYGMLLIFISTIIIFFLLASGMRNVVQQSFGSPYFPYVIWYEFRVLYQIIFYTLLGYMFGMHTSIHIQLTKIIEKNFTKYHYLFVLSAASYYIYCMILNFFACMIIWVPEMLIMKVFLIPSLIALSLYSVCMSFYFYQYFEIDS